MAADYLELDVTGMSADALCDLINDRLSAAGGLYKRVDFVNGKAKDGQKLLLMQTWLIEPDLTGYKRQTEKRTQG